MIELIQHDWTNRLEPQKMAHLVFCDPPYNQSVEYADDNTEDNMNDDVYRWLCEVMITNISRNLYRNGTFWWMCPERHADWVGQLLTNIVGERLYRIVWHEAFSQYQGNRSLTKDYRFIFVHKKTIDDGGQSCEPRWNPNGIKIESERQRMGDKRAAKGGRVPGCVWSLRRLQGTSTDRVDWHPTQLPPELLDRIILGWSNEGDTVIDAFVGSGIMALRAKELNRDFIGVDKSETYISRVNKRVYENV